MWACRRKQVKMVGVEVMCNVVMEAVSLLERAYDAFTEKGAGH
jgi:hypothetical protein